MMYVPKGFAHGFITLADDTEAFYFVDEFYAPELRARRPLERSANSTSSGRSSRSCSPTRTPTSAISTPPGTSPPEPELHHEDPLHGRQLVHRDLVRPRAGGGRSRRHAVFRKRVEEYPDDVRRQRVALAGRGLPAGLTAARSAMSVPGAGPRRGLGPPLPPRGRRHQLQEPRFRRRRRRGEQHPQPAGRASPPSRPRAAGRIVLDRQRLRGGRGGRLAGLCPTSPLTACPRPLTAQVFRYLLRPRRAEPGQVRHPQPVRPLRGAPVHRLPDEELAGRRRRPRAPAPLYVRDNIHVSLLAKAYARFAAESSGCPGFHQDQPQRLRREPGRVHAPARPGDAAAARPPLRGRAEEADRLLRSRESGSTPTSPTPTPWAGTSRPPGTSSPPIIVSSRRNESTRLPLPRPAGSTDASASGEQSAGGGDDLPEERPRASRPRPPHRGAPRPAGHPHAPSARDARPARRGLHESRTRAPPPSSGGRASRILRVGQAPGIPAT